MWIAGYAANFCPELFRAMIMKVIQDVVVVVIVVVVVFGLRLNRPTSENGYGAPLSF